MDWGSKTVKPDRMRMKITYPDGITHEGKKDFTRWTDWLGITDRDFTGLRVHDVATDEGWWAFWAEMRGAEYVEASDVESFSGYDWGWHRDQTFIDRHDALRGGRSVFDFHHANLNSQVNVMRHSVYDIAGEFDVIFCHGLLYHLRHPLLALDRLRQACRGIIYLETFVDMRSDTMTAQSKFYRTGELGPISNWTGATPACVASWMKDAGFAVYRSATNFPSPSRMIFAGVCNPVWHDWATASPNLTQCDDEYWQQVYEATRYDRSN